jgi:hypothetical protein
MNSDQGLTVQLVGDDCKPVEIAGVELDIRFYIHGRVRYTFLLGRTDANGTVRTQLSDFERQLQEHRRVSLMDYNTPLEGCDSVIGIIAPSVEELAQREASRRKWWPDTPAAPETSNHGIRCPEQKFQLSKSAPDKFDLVCDRMETPRSLA